MGDNFVENLNTFTDGLAAQLRLWIESIEQ